MGGKGGLSKHLFSKDFQFNIIPGCVLQCGSHRVIWRVLQNAHLVLFTQPETHGLTTDLDFYSLKDTNT